MRKSLIIFLDGLMCRLHNLVFDLNDNWQVRAFEKERKMPRKKFWRKPKFYTEDI